MWCTHEPQSTRFCFDIRQIILICIQCVVVCTKKYSIVIYCRHIRCPRCSKSGLAVALQKSIPSKWRLVRSHSTHRVSDISIYASASWNTTMLFHACCCAIRVHARARERFYHIISSLETDLFRTFPIEDPSAAHHELDQTQTDIYTEYPMNRISESHSLHHRT